ncbi:thioredoxin-domain-containing protein [Poronia punctata]|nr:thioredoxin-domain-containing protein [Poronia punctata]
MHCFRLNPAVAVAAVAFLSALPGAQAGGLYTKSSPVLQVDAKSYDRLIAQSNHTSIIEFYAPWCGHCQNLKPAYEKAAKNLDGLAKVAAVNCDEDENKELCSRMRVRGFPTLKMVRPSKSGSKPIVDDYQGQRTAKAIVDAVVENINNHVQRVTDKDVESFLSTKNETAKAILFNEKGTTSALIRSLAIDFLDVISFAQIRSKESKAVELFGIESYPTLVLLPGGDKDGLVYEGEMKKPAILKFLSQVAEPNPDPAPLKSKGDKKKSEKAKKEKKEKVSEDSSETTSTTPEPSEASPTESKPVVAGGIPPIPAVTSAEALIEKCLHPKAPICIIASVPASHGEAAEKALTSLSEVSHKLTSQGRNIFPFLEVHSDNTEFAPVFMGFELVNEIQVVAINAKRRWWREYEGDFSTASVEAWIDSIRMNEGPKNKIPEAVLGDLADQSKASEEKPAETVEVKVEEDVEVEVETESESTESKGADPTPEATDAPTGHDEL